MQIHKYHPTTGEYLETIEARVVPGRESWDNENVGKYLIPRYATADELPAEQEGYARCYIEGGWVQVDDLRESTVYSVIDGSEYTVKNVGPLDEEKHTATPRPSEFHEYEQGVGWVLNQELKDEVLRQRITFERDRRLLAGFDDPVTGKTFQCDGESIGKWATLGASAMPWGLGLVTENEPDFTIIATDNSTVTLTATETFQLLQGRMMPWVTFIMLNARALKDADPIPEDFADNSYWVMP